MSDLTRITARPQMREQAQSGELRPAVQMHGFATANPQVDPTLAGLVNGLSAFNPALQTWNRNAAEEMTLKGAANSQIVKDPRDALTGEPVALPDDVPPAFGRQYRDAYNEGLAQRTAIANKVEVIQQYHSQKDQPDFNPSEFLAKKRQAALAGVTDPRAVSIIGQHLGHLEAEINADVERSNVTRVQEVNTQTFNSMLADAASGVESAQQMHANFGVLQERARSLGISRTEAAQSLMLHLVGKSNTLGGAPELFNVFDVKDSNGKTLVDYNPALAPHVAQAKEHSKHLRDKGLDEKAGVANAKVLSQYESDIDTNPASVTMDRLLADFTPHGAFQRSEAVAHMWARAQDSLRKQQGTAMSMTYFDRGELWRLESGQQNKLMDARMSGAIDSLAKANQEGNTAAIAQIGADVLRMHTQSGATVAFDQLKGFMSHLVTTAPNKEGPTAGFTAAAELYKAMSGMPKYRDLYFSEDVSKVLESYTAAEKAGTDPKSAYVQAYQSVSPEAKAAADAFTKTPEFQKMRDTEAKKWVEGSSMNWLRIFGMAGRPQNGDVVGAAVAQEMRSWRARNPFASTDQAKEYAESWTEKNFVIDGTSRSAVRVPSGYSAQAVQQAVTAHSAALVKEMQLGDRNDSKWTVQYVAVGTEGQYQPVMFNGSATQPLSPVNVKTLLDNQKARTEYTPEERVQMGALRKAVAAGQPIPLMSHTLLAKAEALGTLKPAEVQALRKAASDQMLERLNSTPQISLGKVSFDNLQFLPTKGNAKVDNSLTARVSRDFVTSPVGNMGGLHTGYAASLITVGEGVALRAYDDPAKGRNIGMGYSLRANEKTVRSDLKRAMVPEDQIEGVINGTASLTPDQAKRLLLVSLPRYEKQVSAIAEATTPGLWNRMTPAQKAVMLDVAWQTGSTDKFKKAWAALASGDTAGFVNESKVVYTDRNGERKEDTRRNNLRAAMLAGLSKWQAVVDQYGATPSTKLASLKP